MAIAAMRRESNRVVFPPTEEQVREDDRDNGKDVTGSDSDQGVPDHLRNGWAVFDILTNPEDEGKNLSSNLSNLRLVCRS